MNRTDRLTGITLALQAGPRTAASLAARFEVSRRTILRDIEALSELGVPVIAIAGPNGGYRLPDDYWLPPLHFTAEEVTALLFALAHLGDSVQSPLGSARETAEQKIRTSLRPDVLRTSRDDLSGLSVSPAANMPEANVVGRLRRAIREGGWLRIAYQSLRGDTRRAVLPTSLYVADGRWYTAAIDAMSEQKRVFRVDRISEVVAIPPPANAADVVSRATDQTAPYDHPAHPEVRVQLTTAGVRLAQDNPDLRGHIRMEGKGALLAFRCPPDELPYYARELATFCTEASIIGPAELRALVVDGARTLLDHHLQPLPDESERTQKR